jgi:hypothetical protein
MGQWSDDFKKSASKELITASRQAFKDRPGGVMAEATRISAHGGALLSLYLELQTLPAETAKQFIQKIEAWRSENQA